MLKYKVAYLFRSAAFKMLFELFFAMPAAAISLKLQYMLWSHGSKLSLAALVAVGAQQAL